MHDGIQKKRLSPDGLHVRGADFTVGADDWNAQIHGSRRNDPVRHVRNVLPRHLLHCFNDVASERRFFKDMLRVVQGASQIVERRGRQTVLFFDKVENFR